MKMKLWLGSFLGLMIVFIASVEAIATPIEVRDEPGSTTKKVEGWTLIINDALLEKHPQETERAVELLATQLKEIVRTVPEKAVKELQKVPLWFSPEYPGVPPRAEFHPGAGWLRDNHRNPAMEKGVEFTNILQFEREVKRMPNFALHELAHAYHDRVLPDGFRNSSIRDAFERAKARGIYDRVEQRFGDGRIATVKAYAMSNPMEYFAESTEAFFSTNDFFPFDRNELESHDPEMVALLKELWAVEQGKPNQAKPNDYSAWKHSGSMWLITTPEGANLSSGAVIEDFPVLVRLHHDNFEFSQAAPNGEDIRFVSEVGAPLACQIDEWDPHLKCASLWVRVPRIEGNSRQRVTLYWGNPDAKRDALSGSVFDASNGYLGVMHMNEPVIDETKSMECQDTGTRFSRGVIGNARYFDEGKGISFGEKITSLPTGSSSHTTEVWFQAEKPNARLIGWGNEKAQGKVVMQFASPPHIRMDCYFSDGNVQSDTPLSMSQWTQVVYTYEKGNARIYVNGVLDGTNPNRSGPLAIQSPARLYLGGWYNQYDFVGTLDEVRISNVVRSPEWIKLQYENQKPLQTLVGPLVQSGTELSVSEPRIEIPEGTGRLIKAKAGGAQKIWWSLKRDGQESILATNRFECEFNAGRVTDNTSATLCFHAIYPDTTKTIEIPVAIEEDIPDPLLQLRGPSNWDGRTPIEIVPVITNLDTLQSKRKASLHYQWNVENIATIKQASEDRLVLKRAMGSGTMRISLSVDNGGAKTKQAIDIHVVEPAPENDPWIARPLLDSEQPRDNQFIASEDRHRIIDPAKARNGGKKRQGTLVYRGKLQDRADSVFVRVYADDRVVADQHATVPSDGSYSLSVPIEPALVKYRTEFGTKSNNQETILHTAKNIVCGDAYLIIGQSNAVATDFGKENPLEPNEWVRSFGSTSTDSRMCRWDEWGNAEARPEQGKLGIGYWGMELGRRLVESERVPVCFINGAVGGTRIDQHQRNEKNPLSEQSIYGRLLWRAQNAKLTHGIRAVIWHQGENDQGADGPTGGYGFETYESFFVDLAASWKTDYPNLQRIYLFQIWPRSCGMGIRGSDNRLREVQRSLPRLFSNVSAIPTLGIKPPGGCHYPAQGYAEFAALLHPMMRHQLYDHPIDPASYRAANLVKASFTSSRRDEIELEFDQEIAWSDALVTQFYIDGVSNEVVSGSAEGRRIKLKRKSTSDAKSITYLDSAHWSQDNLLMGSNGMAAFTFCDVPIEHSPE